MIFFTFACINVLVGVFFVCGCGRLEMGSRAGRMYAIKAPDFCCGSPAHVICTANYFFLPLYSSETVNFARPFARRAANTRRPFFVAILSRKPCLFFLFLLEGWNVLFIVLYYYMFLFKKYFALFSLQNYSFFLIRQRIREVFCPKMVIFIMLRRGVGLILQNPSLERCSCARDWAFLYLEGLYNVHIRLFIAFLL